MPDVQPTNDLREGLGEQSQSYWQKAWIRFRRHPFSRWAGGVLLLLYVLALFADFVGPYPEAKSFRKLQFVPPTAVHFKTEDGRWTRPYVCKVERTRNPRTFKLEFNENCEKKYTVHFFVHGYPYKFLGFIPMDLHLMGGPWLTEEEAYLFLWGTDDFGRDLFSRIWFGARISLTIGILASIIALILGITFGSISGFYAGQAVHIVRGVFRPPQKRAEEAGDPQAQLHNGFFSGGALAEGWREARRDRRLPAFLLGLVLQYAFWFAAMTVVWTTMQGFLSITQGVERYLAFAVFGGLLAAMAWMVLFGRLAVDVDDLIMRTTEILAAIPGLFLLIILSGMLAQYDLPSSTRFLLVLAILAFVGWGGLARNIRGFVLQLREMEYAQAARALGAGDARILFRHIVPGTLGYLIVVVSLAIPGYILAESGLSFLGLGIQDPSSSWGLLLSKAQQGGMVALKSRPWLFLPGFFIFVSILAYNYLGDALRDALDPRAEH
ncbi:MAG TPA: ABC transporter permease [Oceanithermus profundus]|uniref:ABC transporter permease n=1 Tax=Oceanithermus profundus TaxID=187137 RepID=A0A7C4VK05_9DEIN|nr:ABC transporter permease [Oceanithermus profundus]